ncbi:MAG: 50S ribosomal protein L6 [Candidatus Wildermuthbacteria bacterium]|nr:50S ribosomal protein L6 [Candidatus Wildermuthbacteria bacterium]
MSRIGKKPIEIPAGVEVVVEGQKITLKGPKGTLACSVSDSFQISKEDKTIILNPVVSSGMEDRIRALWGTQRQIVANMAKGVAEGYEKRLEIEGVGYRASVEGGKLMLSVGFTNPVSLLVPSGIDVAIEKNVIKVAGADKSAVGQFAATIRQARPVEPYKGKGIKYEKEIVRRKLGKKAAATAGAAPAK